jgi:hypothetical protein
MKAYIGIDISKPRLDVDWQGKSISFENKKKGITQLITKLKKINEKGELGLAVLEASGGYENCLVKACHENHLPAPEDGNCLFHAILRAIHILDEEAPESSIEEIANLRGRVADRLLEIVTEARDRQQEDADPVRIRFESVFRASNETQRQDAFDDLPPGDLQEEVMQLLSPNNTDHRAEVHDRSGRETPEMLTLRLDFTKSMDLSSPL